MNDLIPAVLVILVGAALASLQASRFPRAENRLLLTGFSAHIASAFIQIWFTRGVYGYGDILGYTQMGELLAAALRTDFVQFAPEVVKLLFHQTVAIPGDIPSQGSTTASMMAVAGVLTYVTGGSYYTLGLCVSIAAYFGQVALYRAFRNVFPPEFHQRLLWAALLIPSEVFWSSALLKETVAMLGLGYLVLGVQHLMSRVEIAAAAKAALGAVLVALVKPYILMPMAAATGAWVYFRNRSGSNLLTKPGHLIVAVALIFGGTALLWRLFPVYSLDNLAEQAAHYQEIGQEVTATTTYAMGDPNQRTLAGQVVYAPIALLTSLFRPFLFEARSPQVFINALETTAILGLVLIALWERRLRDIWLTLTSRPMLMFCLVFVVVFGTGVGLTTTNLGTLSRYRMPLVPFLWAIALVVGAKQARQSAPEGSGPLRRQQVPSA